MGKIRVLIIDDSASVRQTLSAILSADPEIEVIGVAGDPFIAARRLMEDVPDVITLDVEMPRMDGITFLRKLMAQRPIPVVMCSSLTEAGSETLMQALEAGAVDIILKPKVGVADHLVEAAEHIRDVVKGAAGARLSARRAAPPMTVARKLTADAMLPAPTRRAMAKTTEMVACLGASTGGTESLREVLEALPANALGVIMTGMGDDGANGLLEMRAAGAMTLAQDEATSVVFGMPKEAITRGAAQKIAPLDAIAREIMLADRR